jgi:hypothetical protein
VYSIKRDSNNDIGTFYRLFYDELHIHTEYSKSKLTEIKEKLESGFLLVEILNSEFKKKENKFNQTNEELLKQKEAEIDLLKLKVTQLKAKKPVQVQTNITKFNNSLAYNSYEEMSELVNYCFIFKSNDFSAHWKVNEHITKNLLWDNFPIIRSINTHSNGYTVEGIQEKYFAIVCQILKITDEGGSKLEKTEHY